MEEQGTGSSSSLGTATLTETGGAAEEREGVQGEMRQQRNEVMMTKVMVAMDDSDGSFYALRWALDHIIGPAASPQQQQPPGVGGCGYYSVYLVHVQTPFHGHIFPVGPGLQTAAVFTSPLVVESVKKAEEEITASILSRALRICEERKVRAKTVVLNGEPKEMICEATEKMHIDMLVIGSRGHGQIKRALLGSVSDYCAHHAPCPVLIVKAPKQSA